MDEYVAAAPVLLPELVDVDDPRRAVARFRQLWIAEREFLRPLVCFDHLGPEHPDAACFQPRKEGIFRPRARAEGEIVDPFRARNDRMSLGAGEVHEAVAGSDLVRPLAFAVVLPREA